MAADRPDHPIGVEEAPSQLPVVWLAGLAALLVGAIVATVFLALGVAGTEREESGRAEALHVARQLSVNFTTLDYRTYDTDMKRVRELTADEFAEQSDDILGQLRELVRQNQMVSKGSVKEAGLVSYDADSARALVAANSTVSNVSTEQPEERYYRFMLDLTREDAGWRVVDLQIVG
jgi:Mce-associated membrane protein